MWSEVACQRALRHQSSRAHSTKYPPAACQHSLHLHNTRPSTPYLMARQRAPRMHQRPLPHRMPHKYTPTPYIAARSRTLKPRRCPLNPLPQPPRVPHAHDDGVNDAFNELVDMFLSYEFQATTATAVRAPATLGQDISPPFPPTTVPTHISVAQPPLSTSHTKYESIASILSGNSIPSGIHIHISSFMVSECLRGYVTSYYLDTTTCGVCLPLRMLVLRNMGRVCLHAAEDEARVQQAWAEGNDGKDVVAQTWACHIRLDLTSSDLQTTKDGKWFNDQIINYYHAVLQLRQPLRYQAALSVHSNGSSPTV